MSRYAAHVSPRSTPQAEPIPGKPMVANSAGGYAFAVDDWTRLNRFLVLGADGGSYYATERTLTIENAACVTRCLNADFARTLVVIASISDSGRAPKNDPAIFALALAAARDAQAVRAAGVLVRVCRTGTHILQFVAAIRAFRGFGPAVRKLIGSWYAGQEPAALAHQVTKYRSRGDWSHRDVLRRVGPPAPTAGHAALYRWIVAGNERLGPRSVDRGGKVAEYAGHDPAVLPAIVRAFGATKAAVDRAEIIRLIRDEGIPREFIEGGQSAYLNDPGVWDALLDKMPLTAMVRNLGKMSAVGLLKPLSTAARTVADRLADAEYIRKSRLHPLAILVAARTYASGHGLKGSLAWEPVAQVNDALDAAFYASFGNVEPANKRMMIALDVSGSMAFGNIAGMPITPREASAALALVTARTEPDYAIVAFSHQMVPVDLSACMRLTDVLARIGAIPMGGTDCSLPMKTAMAAGIEVETFIVLTDSETHSSTPHPCQALRMYREKSGVPARLIVNAMLANAFTIADPSDAGMLDVTGFDTATPGIMAQFSRGEI